VDLARILSNDTKTYLKIFQAVSANKSQ